MADCMGKYKDKFVFYVIVAAVLAALFFFSGQPRSDSSALSRSLATQLYEILNLDQFGIETGWFHNFLRKCAHFALFTVMGLGLSGIAGDNGGRRRKIVCIALGVLVAILDETHQLFVAGRGAQVSDVILDSCGVLFGYGMHRLIGWVVDLCRERSLNE